MHTRGAKINGKIVPLSYRLKSGDQVEIITSNKAFPNPSWLDYVITSRARSRIRSFLKEDKKQIAEEGKEILRRKLKQLKISFNSKTVEKLLDFFKLKTSLDLYYRVGIGTIDNFKLKKFSSDQNNRFLNLFKRKTPKSTSSSFIDEDKITNKFDQLVFGKNEEQLEYQLSPCCNPIAGDDVFGFVTVSDGVKVHKNECPNALTLRSNYAYRIVNAKWIDSSQDEFSVKLQLTGLDDLGLVNKVTQVISNTNNVNISRMSFDSNDGTFEGHVLLKVKNSALLKKMIKQLENINGVHKVVRE